jgi:hypothetical protein
MTARDEMQDNLEKTRRAYNLAALKYHELFHNEMNEKEYDRRLLKPGGSCPPGTFAAFRRAVNFKGLSAVSFPGGMK